MENQLIDEAPAFEMIETDYLNTRKKNLSATLIKKLSESIFLEACVDIGVF